MPGKEQEQNGIVLEGRKLLDSIIDIRTPRLTLIIRNAFGGAYACFNSYHTGADMVFALPTARIAVMGPAGKDYVYKDEVSSIQKEYQENVKKGMSEKEAVVIRDKKLQTLSTQYERELMNPKEALSLGSVSRIVLPGTTRNILFQNLDYLIRHYKPAPLSGPQREFE
ncbi:carboxyl transferase domain protein [Leptospira borgpetersenii str. Noumea 25]|nr:carboxyl transferase domain protein [Leptospira borgpetersenii str. Noumea 25]